MPDSPHTADIVERLMRTEVREVSSYGYCREEAVPVNPDGPEAAAEIKALRGALEAADKRLCELTPIFPPDVGAAMRDAAGIEETGAVVMQIRAALKDHRKASDA